MTRPSLIRSSAWIVAAGLVVLCTRTLVYALNPTPLALHFEHSAGGPRLPLLTLVALAIGLGVACAVLAGAALGVRERRLLERRPLVETPRLRPELVLLRAIVLFAVTSLAFALVESTIHWRAGLGWHGIHCLTGPVHRDAIPILAALSAVASALAAALDHVLRWMRRTVALLRGGVPRLRALTFAIATQPCSAPRGRLVGLRLGARAPPLLAG
jgi:hypothetical protein